MATSSERSVWGTRLGFILASAGSAVGLGAIWKFPYMAGTNGGSAFILPYIVLTIAIGFIVLMIEMALGRASRGGAAHALRLFGGPFWGGVGKISVLTGFLILSFYQVIGGWCLNYLFDACIGQGLITDTAMLGSHFDNFVTDGPRAVFMQLAFLTLTAGVIVFGVEKGIERISKLLMPTLFILMLCLIVRGLTLPHAWDGVEFMFKFDPEAFNGSSLLNAMALPFLPFIGFRLHDELRFLLVRQSQPSDFGCLDLLFSGSRLYIGRIDDHAGCFCVQFGPGGWPRFDFCHDACGVCPIALWSRLCYPLLHLLGGGGTHKCNQHPGDERAVSC